VAASRESSTGSSYTTPTAFFFRGFGFRFGHPFVGTRRFFSIPRVSILLSFSFFLSFFLSPPPSLSLSLSLSLARSSSKLLSRPSLSFFLSLSLYLSLSLCLSVSLSLSSLSFSLSLSLSLSVPASLIFRSFPLTNRCPSLARVATFGRTWQPSVSARPVRGSPRRRPRDRARCRSRPSYGLLAFASRPCRSKCARCEIVPCAQVKRPCETRAVTDKRRKRHRERRKTRNADGNAEERAATGLEERRWWTRVHGDAC